MSNKRCRSIPLSLLFSRESSRYGPARIILFARVARERERRAGNDGFRKMDGLDAPVCDGPIDPSKFSPISHSNEREINAKPESPQIYRVGFYLSDMRIVLNFMFI